ncbi:MAG TPA: hypothetical protein VGR22_01780, partial [Thermomicrobiales bacterium]|nr:hypothetical protein [Thermomicrobiales bacterium]
AEVRPYAYIAHAYAIDIRNMADARTSTEEQDRPRLDWNRMARPAENRSRTSGIDEWGSVACATGDTLDETSRAVALPELASSNPADATASAPPEAVATVDLFHGKAVALAGLGPHPPLNGPLR